MKDRTKIRRSVKGVSQVISVLLMIAIAVAAALIAYAWIMGYIGGTTNTTGKSLQIQNVANPSAGGSWLIIYVQNVGQSQVHLKQDGSVYVNDVLHKITYSPANNLTRVGNGELLPIAVGQTKELVIDYWYIPGTTLRIKVVTIEGTFMETIIYGSSTSESSTTQAVQVTFTKVGGGSQSSISPSGTHYYALGSTIAINAYAGSDDIFSSWTYTGSMTIAAASSPQTWVTINSGGTIYAHFNLKSASVLVYTAGTSQTLTVGQISAQITVHRQTSDGTPIITGTATVNLASSSGSGTFYQDSGGSNLITSVYINDGDSSASFYYEDSAAGYPTLNASSTGLSSVSTTFTINAATTPKLVYAGGAPQTVTAGQVSTAIIVQRQDYDGTPITNGGTTIGLVTSSNGAFYSDAAGAIQTSSVTIPDGQDSVSFYYKDFSPGSPVLTASASGFVSATTTFTITGGAAPQPKLVYTAGQAQTINTGQVSSKITVERQEQAGTQITTGSITVNLASTSSGGAFYSDSNGVTQINSIPISDGSASANFYYKDASVGSPTLTASSAGYTDATTQFTINQAPNPTPSPSPTPTPTPTPPPSPAPTSFLVSDFPSPATAGTAGTVTVTVKDQYGNTYTGYIGTVHFTSSDGQAALPSNYAFQTGDQGVHGFSATLNTAGTQTITATDTVKSSITGYQTGIQVTHATDVSSLAVAPKSATVTAGGTQGYTATAFDAYGNGWDVSALASWGTDANAGGSWSSNVYTSAKAGIWTVTGSYSAKSDTATLTVNHASAVSLAVAPKTATITAGNSQTYTATATDAYGNTWDVSTPASWSITPAAGGSWSTNVYTSQNAGTWTVTGSYLGNSDTATLTVKAGALDHFTITGYPTSVTAGQSFGGVTVTAYDAYANVETDYTGSVYFTSSDGAAVLPYTPGSKYTFTSGTDMNNGVHTFLGFTLNTAGSKTITVTDGTKSATTTVITVTNPSNNINYNTAISPTSATTGSSVSFTYTITRESSSSNLGWASIQVPAGFIITGTPTATDSNPPGGTWVATVAANTITVHASGTSSELTSNGQYVRVTFTTTVPATEGTYGPFTSTVYQHYDKSGYGPGKLDGNDPTVKVYKAGVLDHFTITGYPSSRTAGQNFGNNNVVITVYDGGNNILTGYTGQVYFTSTDSQAVLPYTSGNKYSFVSGDNGVHTFAGTGFTLNTAGSQTITVTDGSVSATSNTITVNPAAASKLVFTVGAPQTLNVNAVSSVITVQRQDQYGNPVTSGTTSVTLTSSSLNGEFYSDSSGDNAYIITSRTISSGSSTANFYYRDYTAGNPTLTASAGGLTSAISQFTIIGPSNEPRYSTSISTNPSQVVAGSQASFTVTVTMQSTYDVDISKVIITIPSEFNGIAITAVTTNNYGTWTGSLAGNVITLTSGGIYDDLEENSHDAVTVTFTATPQTTGTYTFATSVYGHLAQDPVENFNLGPGSNTGTDPSVTVLTKIFSDDFESGWQSQWAHNTKATITYQGYPVNSNVARLQSDNSNSDGNMTLTIGTTGYSSITLSYSARSTSGYHLYVEWRVGTSGTWSSIGDITSSSWADFTFSFPASAENQPTIQISFRIAGSDNSGYAYVDDVQLVGIPT